jgi:pimeloyl-ACP methyl ester carboxylesterase
MRNPFIHGVDSALGRFLAARSLREGDSPMVYCPHNARLCVEDEIVDLFVSSNLVSSNKEGRPPDVRELKTRVCRIHTGNDIDILHGTQVKGIGIGDFWGVVDATAPLARKPRVDELIAVAAGLRATMFNYVEFDYAGPGCGDEGSRAPALPFPDTVDDEIAELCKSHDLRYRVFRTSLIVDDGFVRLVQNGAALSRFLSALHSFKLEIEERSPQYFDFHALRYRAAEDLWINMVSASVASDLLIRIARTEGTTSSSFWIAGPQNVALADVLEHVGSVYNLSLLPTSDETALNAVDRAFADRVREVDGGLARGMHAPGRAAYVVADIPVENGLLQEESQSAWLESMRRKQGEALTIRRASAEDVTAKLSRKTVAREKCELTYYVGGDTSSPTVVILNALGQGLNYWYRLIENLLFDHCVIIWEPRGTVCPPPPFGLTDQVHDVEAVLRQERIKACHLIGWCTGPKVAVDCYLRNPETILSMAFLNGTLKCDGSSDDLDSPYEHHLESLFRMLMRKPSMAPSIKKSLQAREELSEREMLENPDRQEMSLNVLSRMNQNLRPYVLAPFETDETTLNYAYQMVDFWARDVQPEVAKVTIPVVLISAEYDQVANPAGSVDAARLFPKARHVPIRDATHYCLYDRPDLVANLLKTFFADPDSFVSELE